jgi:hypothetical protein
MTSIVKFRYSGLWNSEYPLVVNRLIDIVERHEPHALHLGVSFDRLAAFRGQLAKIEVQERADRDSAQLSELDQRRDTFFNVIYAVAKAFQRTPIGEVSNHAHRIVTLFKKHGITMGSANYTAQTKRLYDMSADVAAQPEVTASLETLSLKPLFEQMCEVNQEFDALFMQRKHRQAETEHIEIRAIRNECDKAITLLWNAIEHGIAEHGAEQYTPLVNGINTLNAYYKQQLAARATRRKAKQAVENEDAIVPDAGE